MKNKSQGAPCKACI